jgi:hypothetical protein
VCDSVGKSSARPRSFSLGGGGEKAGPLPDVGGTHLVCQMLLILFSPDFTMHDVCREQTYLYSTPSASVAGCNCTTSIRFSIT